MLRIDSELSRTTSNFSDEVPYHCRVKRPKIEIVTETVALALDRTKVSSRCATHILAAAATSLGHNLDDVNLSHSTVHRVRQKVRQEKAAMLKENLNLANHLTVHWDGKQLAQEGSSKKIERLPIVVSGLNSDQLLGVPMLEGGTGDKQAQTIEETLLEWNLSDRIRAMCFDTTAVNTGNLLSLKR